MRQLLKVLTFMALLLAVSLPVMAQEATAPEGMDYSAIWASLGAIVAVIPVMIEMLKGMFPKMPSIVIQILSWVLGIAICMFGWWQNLGFLAGMEWWIALLYGLGSGLAANGIADTNLIQWIIGLFVHKKSK